MFADDPNVAIPRNIRFYNNIFWLNAGAISGAGRYVQANNNTFNGYYLYCPSGSFPGCGGGGAIESETCADQVQITGNTFNGNWQAGSTGPSGMELYSRNLTVSGNAVSGYSNEAIGILSTYNATVTGNHVWDNNRQNLANPEIKIATRMPWPGTCHPGGSPCPAYRDTQGISITNNDSLKQGVKQPPGNVQYGVYLIDGGEGSTSNVNICGIQGQTCGISGNAGLAFTVAETAIDQRVTADTSKISPAPTSLTELGPETIGVFPEENQPLGSPLGTGDPAQNGERFFRFGANDPGGPSNFNGYYCVDPPQCTTYYYASIQGIFDGVADPTNFGFGGPYATQSACRFVYYPVTNTIYLDAPSANFTFTAGSSVVGSGGGFLDNGICRINAGNSTHLTGQQYIELVLDIAFHQTATWYIYEVADNSQGKGSVSNQNGNPGN